ncbi:MAG: TetR/AcrR family transcriptional regulator [Cocleimonas sp.]
MPYLKRDVPCPEPIDCKILTAALDLFVDRGYHNISIHQIQKQADVSIGSIYNHFGGKEGIAKALYKHILNEIDELINDIIIEIESPTEQCKEIIKQLFEHTETHQNIIAFVFHTKHTEFLPDETSLWNASPFIKMRKIINQGIDKQEFIQTDSWVATSAIFGGAIRMIQLRLDHILEKPLPEYYEMVINTAFNGLADDNHDEALSMIVELERTNISR